MEPLVVFTLDESVFALPLSSVDRVVRMVEVTPLPGGPDIVSGIITLQGRVIPVLDVRKRFLLPSHPPDPRDHMIIARTAVRTVTLPVDTVRGVIFRQEQEVTGVDQIAPGTPHVAGVTHLKGNIVLIHDLDRFLSNDEESSLSRSLARD